MGDEDIPDFEVIVGTYEEFILGYKLQPKGSDKNKLEMEQSFTNHSHSGSIRSVGLAGKFLASGSTDEAVRLINMQARVEHGYLQQQSGTITCLTNYGSKFLFSGCDDGTICIWKSGSWICEKTLHAHKGGVSGVSIHPSGKLALSVGGDGALKTWNLIKGRTGYVTNLHANGDTVQWSPEGTNYAVGVSNRVDVYSIQTAKIIYSIPFGKRISRIQFVNEEVIMVAGDKDSVEVHSISKTKKLLDLKAHTTRVKDMQWVKEKNILVTVSNCDGFIKLWKFSDNNKYDQPPTLLSEVNTTCRITCLVVWSKEIEKKKEEALKSDEEMEKEEKVEDELEEEEDSEEEEPQTKKKVLPKNKSTKKICKETKLSKSKASTSSQSKSSSVKTTEGLTPPRKKKKKSLN